MVIAGVNGSGKTTLFSKIKQKHTPDHQVGLISAFRAIRPRYGRKVDYFAREFSFSELTYQVGAQPTFQHEANARLTSYNDPFGLDTSMEAIDPTLCSLKTRVRDAIADRVEAAKGLSLADAFVPDVYEPLQRALQKFLPSLLFTGVETTGNDTYTTWRSTTSKGSKLRFHQLSSGEKNVLTILFPLIEPAMLRILDAFRKTDQKKAPLTRTLLIDEPENHLHESLQRQLLDFLREATREKGVQVLVATHSGSILDEAHSNELYIMQAATNTAQGKSQISRAVDDDPSLGLIRRAFGCTSRMANPGPTLVVEGDEKLTTNDGLSDLTIYRELFRDLVNKDLIIPRGGRQSCKEAVLGIQTHLKRLRISSGVVAILDGDLTCAKDDTSGEIKVLYSPMSTIENWFLAEHSISELLHRHGSAYSLQEALKCREDIITQQRDFEIVRRIKEKFIYRTIRSKGDTIEDAYSSVTDEIAEIQIAHRSIDLTNLEKVAASEVDAAIKDKTAWRTFDGKRMFKEFAAKLVAEPLRKLGKATIMFDLLDAVKKAPEFVEFRATLADALGLSAPVAQKL